MPRPYAKQPLLKPLSGSDRHVPRRVLRGEISDEFGKGICVFTRQEECGFTDEVDFVARENGIAAINFIASSELDEASDIEQEKLELEYRYSIIPEKGCSVEFLKILFEATELDMAQISLSFSWRGDGEAEIVGLDVESGEQKRRIRLMQNQTFRLADLGVGICDFYIKVSTHSLSMSLEYHGDVAGDQNAEISIVADCIFLEKSRVWNSSTGDALHVGSGRIQPDKIQDIIENVEQGAKPASDSESSIEENGGFENFGDEELIGGYELNLKQPGSAYIDVIVSQKIVLYHGEDVILNTSALFADKVGLDATFVSTSLPEWIFLDQKNGDLMGTVPACKEDCLELEFSIYAVDFEGNSAKAIVPVECAAPKLPAGEDLHDYSFSEGSPVTIATIGMFVDFGLNVSNLEFTGEGLPEGLSVDKADGLITGFLKKGSAADAPYNIIITASDLADAGGGISMQFLLDVVENEHLTFSLCSPASSEAIKSLYRMNRESEQILAAGIIGELKEKEDGFIVQEMPLTGSNLPEDSDFFGVPSIHLFSPERYIYLQVQNRENGDEINYLYGIDLLNSDDKTDLVECAPDGFIKIKCLPHIRYVDFVLVQKTTDGLEARYDLCVDTFEGRMMPVHHQAETFTGKQLRQLSAA